MDSQTAGARIVVKVGGSLYDFPDLKNRLKTFLHTLGSKEIVLFPGGGSFANIVRELDSCHGLGQARSHWVAVRSLSLAAHFLKQLLEPDAAVVSALGECRAVWSTGKIGVVDPVRFAEADARRKVGLPRTWEVTSDSLALQLCADGMPKA